MPGHYNPHLSPGSLLAGKYRLLRLIGQGGMGAVWAARHEVMHREVAIKLLLQPDPELVARLVNEARICGKVQHPNVITLYDADTTERGEPFLVMELLQGETLSELLKRKRRVPPAEAARIGRDIAKGLAAAHALDVIHRDLKPSNVFLATEAEADEPTVKLLDFGISKLVAGKQMFKTATGVLIGSPAYMSPEQIRSQGDINARSDLWSLGVVLYEMLAGVRPFQGKVDEILVKVLTQSPPELGPLVRGLDPGFAMLVTACLQRDRNLRPISAAAVATRLDDFVGRDGIPGSVGRGALAEAPPGSGHAAPVAVPAAAVPAAVVPAAAVPVAAVPGNHVMIDPTDEMTTRPVRQGPQPSPAAEAAGNRPAWPRRTVPLVVPPGGRQPPPGWQPASVPQPGSGPRATAPSLPELGDRVSGAPATPAALPSSHRRTYGIAIGAGMVVGLAVMIAVYLLVVGRGTAPEPPPAGASPAESGRAMPSIAPEPGGAVEPSDTVAPTELELPSSMLVDGGSTEAASTDAGSEDRPTRLGREMNQRAPGSREGTGAVTEANGSAKPAASASPSRSVEPFDELSARVVLVGRANEVARCRGSEVSGVKGTARVAFRNDGSVYSVVLKFSNAPASTKTSECITSIFHAARISPFSGPLPPSQVQSFSF